MENQRQQEFSDMKHRKSTTNGGGKSWTDEEEIYLLQMRVQKTPYKTIATKLEKTELACRLHFHQLSHGSNRRKRNNSTSSTTSTTSSVDHIYGQRSPSPQNESNVTAVGELAGAGRFQALNSTSSEHCIQGTSQFQLKTNPIQPQQKKLKRSIDDVDQDRLEKLVKFHTDRLWTVVAEEYGGDITPEMLEKTWKKKCTRKNSKVGSTPSSSQEPSSASTPLKSYQEPPSTDRKVAIPPVTNKTHERRTSAYTISSILAPMYPESPRVMSYDTTPQTMPSHTGSSYFPEQSRATSSDSRSHVFHITITPSQHASTVVCGNSV